MHHRGRGSDGRPGRHWHGSDKRATPAVEKNTHARQVDHLDAITPHSNFVGHGPGRVRACRALAAGVAHGIFVQRRVFVGRKPIMPMDALAARVREIRCKPLRKSTL